MQVMDEDVRDRDALVTDQPDLVYDTSEDMSLLASMIMPVVPVTEWKVELERVAPRLAQAKTSLSAVKSWDSRIQTIQEGAASHWIPAAADAKGAEDGAVSVAAASSADVAAEGLSSLAKELKDVCLSVTRSEMLLNSQSDFRNLQEEYAEKRKV